MPGDANEVAIHSLKEITSSHAALLQVTLTPLGAM
jgi:hypothetical protein